MSNETDKMPPLPKPFAIWRDADDSAGAWSQPEQPVFTADQMRAYRALAHQAAPAPEPVALTDDDWQAIADDADCVIWSRIRQAVDRRLASSAEMFNGMTKAQTDATPSVVGVDFGDDSYRRRSAATSTEDTKP